MQDKMMPILVVSQPGELRELLVTVLGFVEGTSIGEPGSAMSVFSYGSSNVAVANPGVLPGLPDATGPAVYVLEVPDVVATRNVMDARSPGMVGELIEGFFGAFFDVSDGQGHVFRFLQKSEQIAYTDG